MSREIATRVAWSFHGLPYRWGGDTPIAGFDCSGYVIEILKSVGELPHHKGWDATAQGLYERFAHVSADYPKEGRLVFWSNNTGRVVHVEYCLNGFLSIGASGGGADTQNVADAIKHDAYIKVRPIKGRGRTIVGYVDPFELLEARG